MYEYHKKSLQNTIFEFNINLKPPAEFDFNGDIIEMPFYSKVFLGFLGKLINLISAFRRNT